MFKNAMFTLVVCLAAPVMAIAAGDSPWEENLPFESVEISYTLTGMQEGREDLYIRNYGRETATHREVTTTMMGMNLVEKTVEIVTPDWIYDFDLTEQTGSKAVNPEKYMIEEYNKLTATEKKTVRANAEKMGVGSATAMGGTLEKNATKILGYSCDKLTLMGSTIYTIDGTSIPLKTETNTMGMVMKSEATAFEKGTSNASSFEFPAGIKPEQYPKEDAEAKAMAVQTMEMLKDPEGVKAPTGGDSNRMQHVPEEDQDEMKKAMEMFKGAFGTSG